MLKIVKKSLLSWQFFLLLISVVIVSLFSWAYYSYNTQSFSTLKFQSALQQKTIEADNYRNDFCNYLERGEEWFAVDTTSKKKPVGVDILVYSNDSLCCWTGQVLPFQHEDPSVLQKHVAKISNTWYIIEHNTCKQWDVYILIKVKTEYSYKNAFLKDEYAADLPLVLCKSLTINRKAKGKKFTDIDGHYLFTAQGCDQFNPTYANWGIVFLFITVVLFFLVAVQLIKSQNDILKNNLSFLLFCLLTFCLYWVHIHYEWPAFLFSSNLFSPVYFGASSLFPNLGSLLLLSISIFAASVIFYKYIKVPDFIKKLIGDNKYKYVFVILIMMLTFGFWHLLNHIVVLLISNSASASILFKVSDMSFYDIIKIFIVSLLWISLVFVLEKVVSILLHKISKKRLSVISIIFIILFLFYCFDSYYWFSSFMFMAVESMLIWGVRRKRYQAYTTFIWFVGLFSCFAVYSFYYQNYNNEKEDRKVLVENLSFRLSQEEDPLTEMLLKENEDALASDTFVISELSKDELYTDSLYKYLKKNYFSGYLDKFELQFTICYPESQLLLLNDSSTVPDCYRYFSNMLAKEGTMVMGSKHFNFIRNKAGLVKYFGIFKVFEGKYNEVSLFIDLTSKPYFEGPGYPELLLSERESKIKEPLANYSYAKYVDGQLKKQVGDFSYPVKLSAIAKRKKDLSIFSFQKYSHICYHPDKSVCIILSLPEVSLSMILVTFSMFFISFSVFGANLILITRLKKGKLMYTFSVQERIQISFIGLMMVLLFVIASGSVWQTINRFEIKNNQILAEKTRSVLLELDHKIGCESELTNDMSDFLEDLLKRLSAIFYTDINLYGTDGRLISTSRPELFKKGLSGHLMNSNGFIALHIKNEIEFIQRESIGDLKYLSAYVPVMNNNGDVLAYMNMPYFIGSSELQDEISSLVLAIVNFYMIFLMVVIGLTVVVSRKITHPLKDLQSKLSTISLRGRNEKIEYKGDDEIAQLVREYNRMVEELSASAEKLAKSERESAWREMARQIAHEIKNPLTPMKLSIQYLDRAKKDNVADFDQKFNKVSTTLIDQIDKLSSIASEFSNFAKMPMAKRKKMDVVEILSQCVTLFERSKEADIKIELNGIERIYIYADPEQMISVFNNLIKNAIQSIPKKREGIIKVDVNTKNEEVLIYVKDNGLGIREEVKEKLFTPNFTTKSSGMGLGLAIVKNIVVNSKGRIWFDTEINQGSVFHVAFPFYKDDEL